MTGQELRAIFVSAEYRRELEEMSSYLASIKQERPVIYALAKLLRKHGRVFQLEDKHRDLVVDEAHLEFKYNFDCDTARLDEELRMYEDKPFKVMQDDVRSRRLSRSWSAMPQIYEDMCVKRVHGRLADIFVWVICSRDLRGVSAEARKRICWSKEQWKWSQTHPFSDRSYMAVVDRLLDRIGAERPFSVLKEEIETKGDFPSIYHFRICEFTKTK